MLRISAAVLLIGAATAPSAWAAAACGTWTVIPSPDVSTKGDNTFAFVAGRSPRDVWAAGQFIPDSNLNITQTFTAHYDGAAWSAIPSPNVGAEANALHGIAVTRSGQAWAVGYYIDASTFTSRTLIEFWDGALWRVVAHPADPGGAAVLFAVAADSVQDAWAVGEYEQPIDSFHALVEHFDGKDWSIVPIPEPGATGNILYGVAARGGSGAWAVGERAGNSSPDRGLILRWNGASWFTEPAPGYGPAATRLYGIAADAAGALHVAGEAENDAVGERSLAEIGVQGAPFTIQRTPQIGGSDNHFYGVGAAPDGTSWAVGAYFDPASGRQFTVTERADPGGKWIVLPSPSPSRTGDSLLGSVAVVGHDVWAVGAYDGPNAERSLILHSCR